MSSKRAPPRRQTRRRAPNLDEAGIAVVIDVVRNSQGRLTWEGLCRAVADKTGVQYTRQALHRHGQIRAAYDALREASAPSTGGKPLTRDGRRMEGLTRQVQELEKMRNNMLERFARWAYHASSRGLTVEFLDQPLPKIDRAGNR